MITAKEYSERRERFLDKLDEGTLVILFAGVAKKCSADATYDFEVNRNFYYLTGIDQENSVLFLIKGFSENHVILFIDEKDERKEKWTGLKLPIDDAISISGINDVLLTSSKDGKLDVILNKENGIYGKITTVCLDLDEDLRIDGLMTTNDYSKVLKEKYESIKVFNIFNDIARLRMVKSKEEVELIKDAIRTTEVGLNNVLKTMEPGKYEYNLRNIFEFNVHEDMQAGLAFPTICASGQNGVILHYPNATSLLKDGDLVLMDCGARKSYYCADISRTYPISGKFNEKQRIIYQIVLDCNKLTANFIRPGVTLQEVKDFARNFLADECVAKGLIPTKEDIGKVYYHSCSHYLGLDTHDVSDVMDKPLEPGNIITDEPGLYFKELGIGVRIEDDILVTENGSECLSKDIIKEVDDIERILQSKTAL